MNRFLIGQYGGFDEEKYKSDFRDFFFGIEACLFNTQEDQSRLVEEKQKRGFEVGIHYPFLNRNRPLRDALLTASKPGIQEEAFLQIEEELQALLAIQPHYVLFHYPKPVILDNRVNWESWAFASPKEHIDESQYTLKMFREKSVALFSWLSEKAEDYHFTPILEFDTLNRYIYENNLLTQLLEEYPKIRLCLDTARLFIQEKIDPYFSAVTIFKKYSRFADLIHLSNAKVLEGVILERHVPVLPELDPSEGWAPIKQYLEICRDINPSVKILFEHQSSFISKEDLERCYQWVDAILNKGISKVLTVE